MSTSSSSAAAQPSSPRHPAPERRNVGSGALWFGLAGAPAAWSVQTLVNLPVASHGCFPRYTVLDSPVTSVRGIVFVVSIAAVVVTVVAGVTALRSWGATRGERHDAAGQARQHGQSTSALETGEGRTRFMAMSGVLASTVFFLASLAHLATIFFVAPCA